MIDALGSPQSLLLLGGTSDIALAIAERYLAERPLTVVLAGRSGTSLHGAADRLRSRGASVESVLFEAADHASHERIIDAVFAEHEIDIAVVAFGQQPDQEELSSDPEGSAQVALVNYVGAVSSGVILARAMRRQGHGIIVALSSVAGERARASNYTYGSTKAGLDAFFQGLGDDLQGSGVRVLVVRPGFVRTKLTAHMEPAPLATTPEAVAEAVQSGIRHGRHTIWVPPAIRWVMSGLRHIPRPVFRRLPI